MINMEKNNLKFDKCIKIFDLNIYYPLFELEYKKQLLIENNKEDIEKIEIIYNYLLKVAVRLNKNTDYKHVSIDDIKIAYDKLNIENKTIDEQELTMLTNSIISKMNSSDDKEYIEKLNLIYANKYFDFINKREKNEELKSAETKEELLLDLVDLVSKNSKYNVDRKYNENLKNHFTNIISQCINFFDDEKMTDYINNIDEELENEIDEMNIESIDQYNVIKRHLTNDLLKRLAPFCEGYEDPSIVTIKR